MESTYNVGFGDRCHNVRCS